MTAPFPISAEIARPKLSETDIINLIKSENVDDRAAATHKICRNMEKQALSEADRGAAQEIIRILAEDAAVLVRRALAVTLRTSELLPHDVATRLAQDVASIAIPIITHSPVFTDDDLISLIETGGAVRQVAVAKRDSLSVRITGSLSEKAVEEAVVVACANDRAQFDEGGLIKALERFGSSESVQKAMVSRSQLPVSITQKLIEVVSEEIKSQLIAHHRITSHHAQGLMEATQERALLDHSERQGPRHNAKALAEHLHKSGKLNVSMMLRALVRGHVSFFEHSLAFMSGVAHERTWLMVHDAGPLGFKAIYDRAGLPARLYSTFKMAIETYHTLMNEGVDLHPVVFQERLIERFLTQVPYAPKEDMTYLFERLDRDSSGRKWNAKDSDNPARLAA